MHLVEPGTEIDRDVLIRMDLLPVAFGFVDQCEFATRTFAEFITNTLFKIQFPVAQEIE